MIIQLRSDITSNDKEAIVNQTSSLGYKTREVKTQQAEYLVCIGKKDFDIRHIGNMEGITDIHRVSDDYNLVSRMWKVNKTKIDLGDDVFMGDGSLSIMAGPCSIENE
jgi:3-deoxy-7-phosphoheptulonate synthase